MILGTVRLLVVAFGLVAGATDVTAATGSAQSQQPSVHRYSAGATVRSAKRPRRPGGVGTVALYHRFHQRESPVKRLRPAPPVDRAEDQNDDDEVDCDSPAVYQGRSLPVVRGPSSITVVAPGPRKALSCLPQILWPHAVDTTAHAKRGPPPPPRLFRTAADRNPGA